MKKLLLFTIIFAALSAAGCSEDTFDAIDPTPKQFTILAYTESPQSSSRTHLQDGQVLWESGDQIYIMNFALPLAAPFTLSEGEGTTSGKFVGQYEIPRDDRYAYYPMEGFRGLFYMDPTIEQFMIGITLPTTQQYRSGTFGKGANPMAARADGNGNLAFKNLCGAIRLSLTGSSTISTISVATTTEHIAGDGYVKDGFTDSPEISLPLYESDKTFRTITLDNINEQLDPTSPKEFTIVMLPQEYLAGMRFIITDTNGNQMIQTTNKPITVNRGRVLPLANFEFAPDSRYFPDANFRNCLISQYGFIPTEDNSDIDITNQQNRQKLLETTTLNCSGQSIVTLKGIEHFNGLIELNCEQNQLTEIGSSRLTKLKKLNCSNNPLKALDMSECPELEELICYSNSISTLNLTGCRQLATLDCNHNQIKELNLNTCSALMHLYCQVNSLNILSIDNCANLVNLNCSRNFWLQLVALSNFPNLQRVNCSYLQEITELDVRNNLELLELHCDLVPLKQLDVTQNPKLKNLSCCSCNLTELNLTQNTELSALVCYENSLTSLDLRNVKQIINPFYVGAQRNESVGYIRILVYVTQAQREQPLFDFYKNLNVILLGPNEY